MNKLYVSRTWNKCNLQNIIKTKLEFFSFSCSIKMCSTEEGHFPHPLGLWHCVRLLPRRSTSLHHSGTNASRQDIFLEDAHHASLRFQYTVLDGCVTQTFSTLHTHFNSFYGPSLWHLHPLHLSRTLTASLVCSLLLIPLQLAGALLYARLPHYGNALLPSSGSSIPHWGPCLTHMHSLHPTQVLKSHANSHPSSPHLGTGLGTPKHS